MSLIKELRGLMPHRQLTPGEALWLAEHQAIRMRELTGYMDEPFMARDAIESQPKLTIVYDANLPQSGSSHWTGTVWQITINAGEPFTRQRYTLCHELKHILDAPFDEYCYPDDLKQPAKHFAETVCDVFAANLLMPKRLVVRAFTSGGHFQDVSELAKLFGVSAKAMDIRLQDLGLRDRKYRCRHPVTTTLDRTRRFYRAAAPTRDFVAARPVLGGC